MMRDAWLRRTRCGHAYLNPERPIAMIAGESSESINRAPHARAKCEAEQVPRLAPNIYSAPHMRIGRMGQSSRAG